jgi:isocitrate/isopropylmalate dehydrogenase
MTFIVLPCDGIDPEIVSASVRVLLALETK